VKKPTTERARSNERLRRNSTKAVPAGPAARGQSPEWRHRASVAELVAELESGHISHEVWQAFREHDERMLRERLDPEGFQDILERIFSLAQKALRCCCEPVFQHGLELIATAAADLESLCVDEEYGADERVQHARRGDVRARHKHALEALTGIAGVPDIAFWTNAILRDAARIKTPDADVVALEYVRKRLQALPLTIRTMPEQEILRALRVYRLPIASKGRPKKGFEYSTERARCDALAAALSALGAEVPDRLERTLREKRQQHRKRIARLVPRSRSE
jgi:hypothetical protein